MNANTKLPEQVKTQKIIEFEKNVSDSVQNRITALIGDGRLNLPENYSVGNALASAWLIIQQTVDSNKQPALNVCTKESIANALLDMAVLGLNPAKKQGYFIVYGNRLAWFTSYFGKAAAIKRIRGIETEPIGTLIYEGDEIELGHNELGEEIVLSHKKSWANKLKNKIVGAYATLVQRVGQKEVKRSAVMTYEEITEAWTKNPSPNNKRMHDVFSGEFSKRTVINRLVKMILQTSNDDDLLAETMISNENQHYDYEVETVEQAESRVTKEIATNANTGEVIDVPTPKVEQAESKDPEKPEEDEGW